MTKLDEALVDLRQNMRDPKKQSAFYDLFLNSTFLVPIVESEGPASAGQASGAVPLILESDGNDYLMLFSSLERLVGWSAEADAPHIKVPGHLLARSTTPPLFWAMDVGTGFSKQFHPEEIAWLRDSVERCDAEAAKQQGE